MKILTRTLIFISLTGVLLGCFLSSLEILMWNIIPTLAIPVVLAIHILTDRVKTSKDYSHALKHTKNLRK